MCPLVQFIVGMGQRGSISVDVTWNWSNTTATNKLWMGRAGTLLLWRQMLHIGIFAKPPYAATEAGLVVNLNGDGSAWSSPMFGADFPVVPFVPNTWGGANALPQVRLRNCISQT